VLTLFLLLSAAPALVAPVAGQDSPERDGVIEPGEYNRSEVLEEDVFEVHWTVKDDRIFIGLRANTTGWLAIGFGATAQMKDADMAIGYVDSSGDATIVDSISTGPNGPHPSDESQGGTDDIESYDGSEEGGWTVLEYRRDLDTGDQYDEVIRTVGRIRVIWAMGDTDDINVQHSRMGGGWMDMEAVPPGPPTGDLDGVISDGEYAFKASFAGGDLELHWRVEGDRIRLALVARTTGWVALGLEPTQAMNEADMLFGWVSGGVASGVDAFSTGPTGPHPMDTDLGGTSDILSLAGSEAAGTTTIELLRLLSTGDTRDKPIPTEGKLSFIWAFGPSDDWTSKHARTGAGSITIESGEAEEEEKVELWPVHAIFMSLGVGLMLAGWWILTQKKKRKWWFKGHKWIMSGAVSSAIVGLATGIYMIEQSTGVHLRLPHTWIGLVTLIVSITVLAIGLVYTKAKKERKRKLRKVHLTMGYGGVALMVLTLVTGLLVVLLEQ
jgi:uncharacterized membrane protein YidH (DUF202 family)